MTSHTWASTVVMLLANVLPMMGVQVGTEDLTTTITTIVNIVSGLYIIYRGWSTGHFTLSGRRK